MKLVKKYGKTHQQDPSSLLCDKSGFSDYFPERKKRPLVTIRVFSVSMSLFLLVEHRGGGGEMGEKGAG